MYREAIFYGTGNNREKASFISWLLPYMQRYIYKMHRDTYNNFQQNETMKLSSLEVIVVQKLFFKYMLKGRDSSSKRRFVCHCLLQVSICLYLCIYSEYQLAVTLFGCPIFRFFGRVTFLRDPGGHVK